MSISIAQAQAQVAKLIAVMQRVIDRESRFDLGTWRSDRHIDPSEAAYHTCHTSACFAGWVAVSKEFLTYRTRTISRAYVEEAGAPALYRKGVLLEGTAAIAAFVDPETPSWLYEYLSEIVQPGSRAWVHLTPTPEQVIVKLRMLHDNYYLLSRNIGSYMNMYDTSYVNYMSYRIESVHTPFRTFNKNFHSH